MDALNSRLKMNQNMPGCKLIKTKKTTKIDNK